MSWLKQFKDFIARGNVVDLAVAVVIGAAFGAVVASLVADLVTPLIAAIAGKRDFSGLSFTINGSEFKYGSFVNTLIAFLTVSAAVFFVVVKPLNALLARLERGEESAAATPQDVQLLTEIRDILKSRA